jgi:hypothetical protein
MLPRPLLVRDEVDVFETMLRKLTGPRNEDVINARRYMVRIPRSGTVGRMRETRNANIILTEKPRGKHPMQTTEKQVSGTVGGGGVWGTAT